MGVQIKGTVFVERSDENARVYGLEKVKCTSILAGEVTPPNEYAVQFGPLWETLKAVGGDAYDESKLPPADDAHANHEVEVRRKRGRKEEVQI